MRRALAFVFAGLVCAAGAHVASAQTAADIAILKDWSGGWTFMPAAPFPARELTGDADHGWAILSADGRQIAYFQPHKSNWKVLPPTPFPAAGLTGAPDKEQGITIFNGQSIAIYDFGSDRWENCAAAPFPIKAMSGRKRRGFVILGQDGRGVAASEAIHKGVWVQAPPAPFDARGITGDKDGGPIVLASNGRHTASLKKMKGAWVLLTEAPFPLVEIAGGTENGIVAMGADGRAAGLRSGDGAWRLYAQAELAVIGCDGNQGDGRIVALGVRRAAPPPPPPPPPPPSDTQAPFVQIVSPADGQVVVTDPVWVEVRASDDRNVAWVTVNGRHAQPAGGDRYRAQVYLKNGRNQIVAMAGDGAGNRARADVHVVHDAAPPFVDIVNVTDGGFCSTQTYVVEVRAQDPSGIVQVSVNGAPARSVGGDRWQATVSLVHGPNRIVAQATDNAGQSSQVACTLHAKLKPPEVTFNGQLFVNITGRVDDPSATVTVNGQPVAVQPSGHFSASVPVPPNGAVRIVATDRNGLSTERIYRALGDRGDDDGMRGKRPH